MATSFLNVDLMVHASQDPSVLATAWGEDILMLNCHQENGQYQACFELGEETPGEHTPENVILALCHLVSGLSGEAREMFNRAHNKVLDIGFDAPAMESNFSNNISSDTLALAASLGMDLAITVYPYRDELA